jgi:CRP-like cAMP-binding protein
MRVGRPLNPADYEGLTGGWLRQELEAFVSALINAATIRRLGAGSMLHSADDEARQILGLASGFLALKTPVASGEEVIAHVAGPGIWLGATMVASLEVRRHISAVARTDVTLAIVSLPVMRQLLANNPEWWPSLARLIESHWKLVACMARDLMLRDHRQRIAATLLRLSGVRPGTGSHPSALSIPVTQQEIETMANCSQSFVHAEMKRLAGSGAIEMSYGRVEIKDPAAILLSVDA